MQIMPATASFVTKNSARGRDRHLLLNPLRNLEIGQAYINSLLDEPPIDRSVVRLLAAYNGVRAIFANGLLRLIIRMICFMIESIPARETRHYIKSVISNLALYRSQLGQASPALREQPRVCPVDLCRCSRHRCHTRRRVLTRIVRGGPQPQGDHHGAPDRPPRHVRSFPAGEHRGDDGFRHPHRGG